MTIRAVAKEPNITTGVSLGNSKLVSASGPSRHLLRLHKSGRYRGEAGIQPTDNPAEIVENGPERTFVGILRISIGTSLKIRKLIFRNDSLDFLGLALDAVSNSSIGLDGHMLDDCVNHWRFSCGPSLWALGLVANVFI